jgi:hypothetical protein
MPSAPHWKLRRLAPRAKRVLARRTGESPALAAYSATLPGKADAFIKAYDSSAKYQTEWRREMKEGKGAVADLLKLFRGWLPLLARDVPGFDSSSFGDQPDVPDDVIEDAERILLALNGAKDKDGKALSYEDAASGVLEPAIQAAIKEWSEAEMSDAEYQSLLAMVRSTAEAFDKELQAFRLTLGSVVGRTNKDFQKLRAERASQADDEDESGGPKPPAVVEAAAPGAGPPAAREPG